MENSPGGISNVVKYCIWHTMNVRLVAFGAVTLTLNVFGVNVLSGNWELGIYDVHTMLHR